MGRTAGILAFLIVLALLVSGRTLDEVRGPLTAAILGLTAFGLLVLFIRKRSSLPQHEGTIPDTGRIRLALFIVGVSHLTFNRLDDPPWWAEGILLLVQGFFLVTAVQFLRRWRGKAVGVKEVPQRTSVVGPAGQPACPRCGAGSRSAEVEVEGLGTMVRCSNCGHEYLLQQTS